MLNTGVFAVILMILLGIAFSLVPSASKIALIFLARFLQQNGGALIDCQFETPHLKTMGGRHIPYDDYMKIIQE
jgi:leucyl/phenylalanyl-tRNA--protein transferase